jgi:hypothetical protein
MGRRRTMRLEGGLEYGAPSMNAELSALTDQLEKRPAASLQAIRDRERELGIQFPPDYVEFMLASNGAEGFVGGGRAYIRIEPIEEMMNDRLQETLRDSWPGLVVFGSDGAGEAFAFDPRGGDVTIVMFPWIGHDEEEILLQGRTFTEFLRTVPRWRARGA